MKVGLFLVSILSKNKLVGGKRVFSSDFFKRLKTHTIMYTTVSLEWKGQTITIIRRDDSPLDRISIGQQPHGISQPAIGLELQPEH